MFVFEGAWMFVSKQESRIWDDRYRSAIEEEGRVLRQSISDNVMQVPERIASMLDIGCGMGDMVMAWAERGVDATGLDISAEAIQYAKASAEATQRACCFVAGDWAALDLDSYGWRRKFDLVFSAMGPDMRESAVLRKMMESSRRYCRLLLFKDGQNELAEAASQKLGCSLPSSPPCGEEEILSLLSAHEVSLEDVICTISYEASTAHWSFYLQTLFPAQEYRSSLDQIIEEYGGYRGRMAVQTNALYRMLTWAI